MKEIETKLIRKIFAFRWLCKCFTLIFAIGVLSANIQAQDKDAVPEYPSGAIASFPEALKDMTGDKLPIIYIKRQDGTENKKVWILTPLEVSIAATEDISAQPEMQTESPIQIGNQVSPLTLQRNLGFVVPQLERGVYVAWYETPSLGNSSASISLAIVPKLTPAEGLITTEPGREVQLRVGISSTFVLLKGEAVPSKIQYPVKLESLNPDVADLALDQNQNMSTDDDGYATWRIKIKKAGQAQFIASAVGLEKAEIFVVGESLEREAAELKSAFEDLEKAKAQVAALEDKMRFSVERVKNSQDVAMVMKQRVLVAPAADELQRAVRNEAKADKNVESRMETVEARIGELNTARERMRLAQANYDKRLVSHFTIDDLQPGDVLLVRGNTPFISSSIAKFERDQLGQNADYSHASLYVGKASDGTPLVAEMWNSGYFITPFDVSTSGAIKVDAYRWNGIAAAQQNKVADIGKSMFSTFPQCFRKTAPSAVIFQKSCAIPYAYSQIGFLSAIAKSAPSLVVQQALNLAENDAMGTKKMICSEFVAWVYQRAGLDPQVTKWWRGIEEGNFLINDNRRKDYTTPNMLAFSPKFKNVGCIKGCSLAR